MQAVRAIEYERRTRDRPKGVNARQAAGHDRRDVRARRSISVLLDRPKPFVILDAPSRGEASRAARYDSLVGKLAAFRMSPKQFERRISGWRPIRGERFLADPNRVLTVLEARRAGEQEIFIYESGRP
jgi:hypothetical protein